MPWTCKWISKWPRLLCRFYPHSQTSRLKLQALNKQAKADSERRTIASARTKLHNRINKSNAAMVAAVGSAPAIDELEDLRLRRLLDEDEWGLPDDKPRTARTRYKLREDAEFRPIDLPSSRGLEWRALATAGLTDEERDVRTRAMDIQRKVVIARLDETLGEIRTRIVDQANTYLQKIRSRGRNAARGYNLSNHAYAEAQNQGKAVRVHAQIYNICRDMLEPLAWDKSPAGVAQLKDDLARYRPMRADDVKCSTETYSTAGVSANFALPWFWRMVPRDTTESPEVARERDEEFVAECAYSQ